MSGSANAGTTAERHQTHELKILTRRVRALASAPGHVCFSLTEDLHGCRTAERADFNGFGRPQSASCGWLFRKVVRRVAVATSGRRMSSKEASAFVAPVATSLAVVCEAAFNQTEILLVSTMGSDAAIRSKSLCEG